MTVGAGTWAAWLTIIAASFAVFETIALKRGGKTLSRTVSDAAGGWPLLPVVYGMLWGGLAVHFFWRWC